MKLISQTYASHDEKLRLIDVLRKENIGIESFNDIRSALLLKDLTPNSKVTINELLFLQDFSNSEDYKAIADIRKQIRGLQKEIGRLKKEQAKILDSFVTEKSDTSNISSVEKEVIYAKYYRQEYEKYLHKEIRAYCRFPLSEKYSEEAWQNMLLWKDYSLGQLTRRAYTEDFHGLAHYYAAFDYALGTKDRERFISKFEGNYEYSKENNEKMNDWIFGQIIYKVEPVRQSYGSGIYSDDEEGIMNALRHGDGDSFGF